MINVISSLNNINMLYNLKNHINVIIDIIQPQNIKYDESPIIRQMIANREIYTIKNGYLTVAVYNNFPLVAYYVNNKLMGIDVEIIEKYANFCNLKVEYKYINLFDGIWNLPEQRKADISIGGIVNAIGRGTDVDTALNSRKDAIEWSMPYLYFEKYPSISQHFGTININKNLSLHKDGKVFAFPTRAGSGIASSISTFITLLIYEGELNKILSNYGLYDDSLRDHSVPGDIIKNMIANRQIKTIKNNILTVAVYTEFPPVAYYDKDDKLIGSDVDIIEEYAKICKLTLEWKDKENNKRLKFDGIWNFPEQRKADISIGGIANALGRGTNDSIRLQRESTDWTMPYFYVHRSMIYSKKNIVFDSNIIGTKNSTGWTDALARQNLDLKSKKLTAIDELLTKKIMSTKAALIEGTTNHNDIKMILDGNAIGMMRGDFVALAIVKDYPDELGYFRWNMLPELLPKDGEIFTFPTRLGSGIAPSMSMFIASLIYEGKLNKVLLKYNLIDEKNIDTYYKPIPDTEIINIPRHIQDKSEYMTRLFKEISLLKGEEKTTYKIQSITQSLDGIIIKLESGCELLFNFDNNFSTSSKYPWKQPFVKIIKCNLDADKMRKNDIGFYENQNQNIEIKGWAPAVKIQNIIEKVNASIILPI